MVNYAKPSNGGSDYDEMPTKADLKGALLVITLDKFDSSVATEYGDSAMAVCNIVVADGSFQHAVLDDWAAFGNLAKQIARGLKVGETGVGRIITGAGKTKGSTWWGIEWAEDAKDFAAADKAFDHANEAPF